MILQETSLQLATKKSPLHIRRNLKGKDRLPLPPFFRGELLVLGSVKETSPKHNTRKFWKGSGVLETYSTVSFQYPQFQRDMGGLFIQNKSEYCFTKAVIAEIAENDQEDFLEEKSFLGQRVLGGPTRQLDTSVITHICIYI